MDVLRTTNPATGSIFTAVDSGDVERVKPIEYYRAAHINMFVATYQTFLLAKKTPYPLYLFDELLKNKGEADWEETYRELIAVPVPQPLVNILSCTSKKEQVRELKGLSLENRELQAFVFTAWEKYGFTFSQYRAMHYPNGFDKTQLPTVFYKEGDTVTTIGETSLTEGQLGQAIEHRHATVAKILDNGSNWHCFFLTYKSLNGKEAYKDGTPHLHYISNLWGLTREKVVAELKSKNYNLPSVHIDYHTHRNPRPNQ